MFALYCKNDNTFTQGLCVVNAFTQTLYSFSINNVSSTRNSRVLMIVLYHWLLYFKCFEHKYILVCSQLHLYAASIYCWWIYTGIRYIDFFQVTIILMYMEVDMAEASLTKSFKPIIILSKNRSICVTVLTEN